MARDRRAEILEIAAELFATRGIGATTVREIGDRAGVFSGSLYHYFPSKNAIVAELLATYMADIQARFAAVAASAAGPRETVRGLIAETLAVIDDHPHPTAIYQQDRQYLRKHDLLEAVDGPSREVRRHWLEAIDAGIADGTFRDDVPAEVFYRAVRDALWASRHWPDRARWTREQFTEQVERLFLHGFVRHSPGDAPLSG